MGFTWSSSIILLPTGLPFASLCPNTVCVCVYSFFAYSNWMHTCAKHFNLQPFKFSLTVLFSLERAAVKSCIEHHIQHLMFTIGYSISHQGSDLGVYFMAFPVERWDWKWKSCQGHSYYQQSKGILLMPQNCIAVFGGCECMWVGVCALGVVLLNVGKCRCTCWWENWDGECFQSATSSPRNESCLSGKRLWAH